MVGADWNVSLSATWRTKSSCSRGRPCAADLAGIAPPLKLLTFCNTSAAPATVSPRECECRYARRETLSPDHDFRCTICIGFLIGLRTQGGCPMKRSIAMFALAAAGALAADFSGYIIDEACATKPAMKGN